MNQFSESDLKQVASHVQTVMESLFLRAGMDVPIGIDFTEEAELQYHGQVVKFSGASFQSWVSANLPITQRLVPIDFDLFSQGIMPEVPATSVAAINMDKYLLMLSVLPAGKQLAFNTEQHFLGACFFDTDVNVPVLFEWETGDTWMSLTPQEIATCRSGIQVASGNVLVGGLGLGWQTQKILQKQNVQQVTVVEQNPAVIDGIGHPLLAEYSDRVEFVCGDVWDYLGEATNFGKHDSLILDVWAKFGEAYTDARYLQVKSQAQAQNMICWGWGDVPPPGRH